MCFISDYTLSKQNTPLPTCLRTAGKYDSTAPPLLCYVQIMLRTAGYMVLTVTSATVFVLWLETPGLTVYFSSIKLRLYLSWKSSSKARLQLRLVEDSSQTPTYLVAPLKRISKVLQWGGMYIMQQISQNIFWHIPRKTAVLHINCLCGNYFKFNFRGLIIFSCRSLMQTPWR